MKFITKNILERYKRNELRKMNERMIKKKLYCFMKN